MNYFRDKSPKALWNFAVEVTKFAKTLHDLKIKNLYFKKKITIIYNYLFIITPLEHGMIQK